MATTTELPEWKRRLLSLNDRTLSLPAATDSIYHKLMELRETEAEAKAKLDPANMFKVPGEKEKYSRWDNDGVPTHDAGEEKISKSGVEELQKNKAQRPPEEPEEPEEPKLMTMVEGEDYILCFECGKPTEHQVKDNWMNASGLMRKCEDCS